MEKGHIIEEWTKGMFKERPYRSFTAGECAREAGVSVNTAKKYLRRLVSQDVGMYDFLVDMANGLVATCYAFTNVRED